MTEDSSSLGELRRADSYGHVGNCPLTNAVIHYVGGVDGASSSAMGSPLFRCISS